MTSHSLRLVDADEAWPEAGRLIARALEGSDDTAEEVLALCRAGGAFLLASGRAFVVVQVVVGAGGLDLLVWAAVSRGARNCIAAHLAELERMARAMGAAKLIFKTGRRGFERVMPEGWSIRQYVWAKEL
jgi:hypothetical protein